MTCRFDTIETLTDEVGSLFFKVFAIFSLTKQIKGQKKILIDTILITAHLQKINKRHASGTDRDHKYLPYPIYKFRVPANSRTLNFYVLAIGPEDIYRPACFIDVYTQYSIKNNANISEYAKSRFYGFDLRFCDRSMWNSTEDKVGPFASLDNTDIIEHSDGIQFILNHETQIQTYKQLDINQGNVHEKEDSSDRETSSDEDDDI